MKRIQNYILSVGLMVSSLQAAAHLDSNHASTSHFYFHALETGAIFMGVLGLFYGLSRLLDK